MTSANLDAKYSFSKNSFLWLAHKHKINMVIVDTGFLDERALGCLGSNTPSLVSLLSAHGISSLSFCDWTLSPVFQLNNPN